MSAICDKKVDLHSNGGEAHTVGKQARKRGTGLNFLPSREPTDGPEAVVLAERQLAELRLKRDLSNLPAGRIQRTQQAKKSYGSRWAEFDSPKAREVRAS